MKITQHTGMAMFFALISINGCNSPTENHEVKEVAKPPFDLASAKTEIEAVNKTFMELVAKGDSVAIANLYTTDAKLLFPGMPPVAGKAAIQSVFGGILKSGVTKVQLITKEVFGTEVLLGEEEEVIIYVGDKIVAEDKAMVIWKKEDGKWKLFRDMTNPNKAQK